MTVRRTNDGGAICLAGFVYQLLGSAALFVHHCDSEGSEILLEERGQDAIATSDDAVRLIQFKYSRDARKGIACAELADLLLKLQQSEDSLSRTPASVSWILHTNRNVSRSFKRLSGSALADICRDAEGDARRTVERLSSRLTIERLTLLDIESALRDRARSFGVDDLDRAAERVLGALLRIATRPTGDRRLDRDSFEAALAGYPRPRSIRATDSGCADRLRQEIARAAHTLKHPPFDEAIPRRDVEAMLRRPTEALVVLTGRGGCGKSLSLLKAMHDSSEEWPSLVGALLPRNSQKNLPELIASWRSADGLPAGSLADSMCALEIANETTGRPVLLLALDGLDESPTVRREAEELILHFYQRHLVKQEQTALLVVTCRTRERLDEILAPDGTGGEPARPVHEASVTAFTNDELDLLWKQWFGESLDLRFLAADDAPLTRDREGHESVASLPLGDVLRTPVILGLVKQLAPDDRERLLQGDEAALALLLEQYIDHFSNKARRRTGYGKDKIAAILRAAAVASKEEATATTYDINHHWIEPAWRETGLSRSALEEVFREAVTAGLIDTDSDGARIAKSFVTWRWCLEPVRDYFANLGRGDRGGL